MRQSIGTHFSKAVVINGRHIIFFLTLFTFVELISSFHRRFEHLKEVTFPSTFCYLLPSEARIIVEYWEEKRNLRSRQVAYNSVLEDEVTQLERVLSRLTSLQERLQSAIVSQTALSPVGRVFVKLSTRSPKDSKRALAKAKVAYEGSRNNCTFKTMEKTIKLILIHRIFETVVNK